MITSHTQSLFKQILTGLRPVLFIAVAAWLFLSTTLTSIDIFFVLFTAAIFLWNFDSRVALWGAIIGLICIPALIATGLLMGNDALQGWSERVAVWTFYFLVIGVAKQLSDAAFGKKPTSPVESTAKSVFEPSIPDYSRLPSQPVPKPPAPIKRHGKFF